MLYFSATRITLIYSRESLETGWEPFSERRNIETNHFVLIPLYLSVRLSKNIFPFTRSRKSQYATSKKFCRTKSILVLYQAYWLVRIQIWRIVILTKSLSDQLFDNKVVNNFYKFVSVFSAIDCVCLNTVAADYLELIPQMTLVLKSKQGYVFMSFDISYKDLNNIH